MNKTLDVVQFYFEDGSIGEVHACNSGGLVLSPIVNVDSGAVSALSPTPCSLFRDLWISCRYKNATLHIGDNISNLNRMAKRGWRVQKIDTVRVGGANGSFRDYFQAQIINKSILGFFAPKNSHKIIGETPVSIGGGALDSNSNQLPSQFGAGGQIPFVGDNDSIKFNELSEVGIGGYIHSKEILSANVEATHGGTPLSPPSCSLLRRLWDCICALFRAIAQSPPTWIG